MVANRAFFCQLRSVAGPRQMWPTAAGLCYSRRSAPALQGPENEPAGWGFLPKFSTPVEKIVENRSFRVSAAPLTRLFAGISSWRKGLGPCTKASRASRTCKNPVNLADDRGESPVGRSGMAGDVEHLG